MDYIINDIENLIVLDKLKIFSAIRLKCNSIKLTSIKLNEYSQIKRNELNRIEGIEEIDPELDFYNFEQQNKKHFAGLSLGDKSSLYIAKVFGSTLVTFNALIYIAAKKLSIEVLYTDEFIRSYIMDSVVIDLFNEIKV